MKKLYHFIDNNAEYLSLTCLCSSEVNNSVINNAFNRKKEMSSPHGNKSFFPHPFYKNITPINHF